MAELSRVYPVLRTTFVTDGPAESWHQYIRDCREIGSNPPPIIALSEVNSWAELIGALEPYLEGRDPDYRYAVAYGSDDSGCLRVALAFDHMVFDIKSIDIVLAHLARNAEGEGSTENAACRCGSNEFVDFVKRTTAIADKLTLPERYEWAHELMLAARSPHAYVMLPVAIPMSKMDAGGTTRFRSRFVTDPSRRYRYTPFAAFVSALTLSLEVNFGHRRCFTPRR